MTTTSRGVASGRPSEAERLTRGQVRPGTKQARQPPAQPQRGHRPAPVVNGAACVPTQAGATRVVLDGVADQVWVCINELSFNGGRGRVDIDGSATATSVLDGSAWQVFLRFTSAAERRPAWHFLPSLNVPQIDATARYDVGFIQTVELLRYTLHYQGLPRPYIASAARCRDALTSGVPAPWFGAASPHGPIALDLPDDAQMCELQDSPQITARVFGSSSRAVHPLERVEVEGRFHWWLAIKHERAAGTQLAQLQFLYHASIEMRRGWRHRPLGPNPDPSDPAQWVATGEQRYLRHGLGRGPEVPVLIGRTANEQLRQQMSSFRFP